MSRSSRIFKTTVLLVFILVLVVAFPLQADKKKSKKAEVIQCTNPALRMQWFAAHQKMIEESPHKKLKWYHIGPTNISGRSTDIAVVTPKGKNYTIYVATGLDY